MIVKKAADRVIVDKIIWKGAYDEIMRIFESGAPYVFLQEKTFAGPKALKGGYNVFISRHGVCLTFDHAIKGLPKKTISVYEFRPSDSRGWIRALMLLHSQARLPYICNEVGGLRKGLQR